MKFNVSKLYPRVAGCVLFALSFLFIALLANNLINNHEEVEIFYWLFLAGWFLLSIVMLVVFMYYGMLRKVVINEHGVKYFMPFKNFEIKWDEMKNIGIFIIRIDMSFIYFSTEDEKYMIDIIQARGSIKNDSKCFVVNYRKKVEKEIKKYWDHPIKRSFKGLNIELNEGTHWNGTRVCKDKVNKQD